MENVRITDRPAERLIAALEGTGSILLTGPEDPDGDSVGACLALQRILQRRGLSVDVAGVPSYRYAWMPGADAFIDDERVEPVYDAVVVLDGDRHRLTGPARAAFDAADVKGIIDHHASTGAEGYTHPWIDRHATSTCEMIYDAMQLAGEPLDHELAVLLYVGAIFDTGGFRYSNTTPATHRMAARLLEEGIDHSDICARILMERRVEGLRMAGHVFSQVELLLDGALSLGAVPADLADELGLVSGDYEGLVDSLVFTEGVEVAVLLIERGEREIKASLRSRGRVDVADVAQTLIPSGGGHAKAAGAVLACSLDEARDRVATVVGEHLDACPAVARG